MFLGLVYGFATGSTGKEIRSKNDSGRERDTRNLYNGQNLKRDTFKIYCYCRKLELLEIFLYQGSQQWVRTVKLGLQSERELIMVERELF
ncbi:hypothetical protein AK85_09925 [Streptococcus pneumoniae B1598]|nr:hypothetical protein AK85_09925 [Streptococcus pneumoniae B1598]